MRSLIVTLGLALALVACGPVAKKYKTDPRLDPLFAELKAADNPVSARMVEAKIWSIWSESGSATVDILLERAQAAEASGDKALARSFLDQAVQIMPDYAEAYNRRAVLAFDADDRSAAVADIEAALEREPRHFAALTGLDPAKLNDDRLGRALDALAPRIRDAQATVTPRVVSVLLHQDSVRPQITLILYQKMTKKSILNQKKIP